ncbi:MAG: hypothetical protein BV458_13630, partial [Thermoplasmata archaeon M9B2D]
ESSQFPPLIIPPDIAEGVERCVLQIRLMNEDGIEIAEGTSKPFYVGFVKRGPQVVFDWDLKSSYIPGELVVGHIVVSDRNNAIGPSARMVVDYLSESGKAMDIETFQYEEFMKRSATFQWRIPRPDIAPQVERVGAIRVRVIERGDVVTSVESDRFSIDQVTTRVNLDSMRVPQRSHIGGKISGWLRIRRNTEQGDPAFLTLAFVFPDDEEYVVLRQAVKQSKNLSLAFGPLTIPAPKKTANPKSVKLVAVLSYIGLEMDSRSTTIDLVGGPSSDFARINFIGLPSFTVPDQMLQVTIQVESDLRETIDCVLSVGLESIAGNSILIERNINLELGKPRMIPVPFRVPLGAEMSTAHLKAVLMCGSMSCENSQRFKVKAIEKPFFKIGFSIRNEAGEEIPGLVARLTPVEIVVDVESAREDLQGLKINLRVMSRREIIKEFDIPLSNQKKNTVSVKWLTPPIDIVTGYFLEAEISQHARPLPHRAIEMVKKQFTVY